MAHGASGYLIGMAAPGRGAWLHPGCGALALRRRAVPRALRLGATDVAGLADLLAAIDAPGSAWANRRRSE